MNLQRIDEKLALNWRRVGIGIGVVLGLGLVLVAGGLINGARAEGVAKRGAVAAAPVPISEVAEMISWNGLGVGVYGSWIGGQLDTASPVNIGAEGSALGGSLSYSVQASIFVAEVFGEYGFMFGDLKTIGAEAEMALGGKAGILANPSTLIYGLGAKSWIDPEKGDMIDGWQFGGGVAVKLPSAPLVLSLEYRRGLYDIAGLDVSTDTVRAGLTYKFGFGR